MNPFKPRKRGFEHVVPQHMKNDYIGKSAVELPRRSDARSAGYDIYAPCDFTIPAKGAEFMLWTDVKVYMLADEVLILAPRSNQGKLKLRFANTIGVIDSSYYGNPSNDGNIGIMFVNGSAKPVDYKKGDRIAQAIFLNYLLADNDNPISSQRTGGYGSSGR